MIWIIVILLSVLTLFVIRKKTNKLSVSKETRTLSYIHDNGVIEKQTLKDIYTGNVPRNSIFSAYNPNFFINVSGMDKNDNVIFSTHWRTSEIMTSKIKPLSDIHKFFISLATSPRSTPPPDVWKRFGSQ